MIYEGISGLNELYAADPASRGLRAYMKGFQDYVEEMCRIFDDDRPVVWHNCGLTPELVLGLEGSANLPIETYPVLEDIVGDASITCEHIDLAESHGLPSEICSVDKAALGSALKGLLPEPVCFLGVNTPCDSQVAAVQTMAEFARIPIFLIDIPYLYGEREVHYVSRQMKDAISFLEKHTGRKWNPDLLREACSKSNQMSEYLLEWNELRKAVPCPQVSKVVGLMIPLFIAFGGTDNCVFIARELAAEARERIERGEAAVAEEQIRCVWYQDPIWFDLQFYDWLESELKLVVPMDLFGYHAPEGAIDVSSTETMLEGLARRIIRLTPMTRQFKGPIDIFLDDFARICSDYRADMAVFAGHVACKHGWGGIGFLKEKAREIGVPLLVFEFDMFDPRVTTFEALQDEFSRFVDNVVRPRLEA
jgi:benzoyl-CoA reductase/2-hydroxyglutaryl-CoA dehydratase subunit BcrC/BadD/HgdB